MKTNTETVFSDNGVDINVQYDYEISPSDIQEGHGLNEVGRLVTTELTCIEVIIKGTGIDILPLLNRKQMDEIISKLNYDNE